LSENKIGGNNLSDVDKNINRTIHPTIDDICNNCQLGKEGNCEGEDCRNSLNGADK